jgi:hypothetical protein
MKQPAPIACFAVRFRHFSVISRSLDMTAISEQIFWTGTSGCRYQEIVSTILQKIIKDEQKHHGKYGNHDFYCSFRTPFLQCKQLLFKIIIRDRILSEKIFFA